MKKNLPIIVLTITALVLVTIHALLPTPARAEVALKDRDYQVVTARITTGGDGLYIMDIRSGQIAVFTYDPASRAVRARVVRNVSDAFAAH